MRYFDHFVSVTTPWSDHVAAFIGVEGATHENKMLLKLPSITVPKDNTSVTLCLESLQQGIDLLRRKVGC